MLRLMREKFKSLQWILWAVIASFVLWIFVAWGMGAGGGGGDFSDAAALALDVDGRTVTRTDFVRQLRDTEANYRRQFGEQADQFLKQLNVREQVASSLVTRELALREAGKAGLKVTDNELRDYILATYVDESGKFVGVERLERFARRAGYTDQQFKQALSDDLLSRKFQAIVEAGVVIADPELKSEYLERNDRARADYVFLDARALGRDAKPSDAELEAFFNGHRDQFAREERRARYVVFASADFAAKAAPSEEDLRKEYEQQQRFHQYDEKRQARHILLKTDAVAGDEARKAELRTRALALYEQAKGGADFAALAQANSQDEGSAARGGDLGMFGRGQMVKPFEEAVFTMTVGEVVGPVETQFGFHVIKLEAIQPPKSFDEVRGELETRVRNQKSGTLAREAAAAAAKEHLGDGKIDEVAKAAGKAVAESGFLRDDSREGGVPGIEAAYLPSFAAALFRIAESGKIGADPISIGSGFAVLQFAEKRGPIVPPFAEVRAKVEEASKLDQGKAAAARKVAEIQAALAKGSTLEEAATAAGAEVKASQPFARNAAIPGVPGSEAAAAAVWQREVGKIGDPIALEGGTVLVRTSEKFQFDEARYESEKETLRGELERERRYALWSALIRGVRKDLEASNRIRYLAPDLLREPESGEDDVAF